jgi:hypothetical protein
MNDDRIKLINKEKVRIQIYKYKSIKERRETLGRSLVISH